MKKKIIFSILILASALGYYKYTKAKREELIRARISQIKTIDPNSLAKFLQRVEKVKKRAKMGVAVTHPVKHKRSPFKRQRVYTDNSESSDLDSNDDEELEEEELDSDDEEEEEVDDEEEDDDEAKPVATPRGRLKPLSPAALKRIRAAAEARMKELLERKRRQKEEEEE